MKLNTIKVLIIFCILASIPPRLAWACRCDSTIIKEIVLDPAKANGAFTARAKNDFLEVSKSWKSLQAKRLKIEASWPGHVTKCDLVLEQDTEYLFLSVEKIVDKVTLSICGVTAIKFGEAKDLISKLEKATPPAK